jgi:hypothetical protein
MRDATRGSGDGAGRTKPHGDPVNFSDPFGFDPCEESGAWTECLAEKIAN